MDIRAALEEEHSKAQTMRLVEYVGKSPARFGEIVEVILGGDPLLAQRAAWAISHCAETNPSVVEPHLCRLIENLHQREGLHDAIKRNTMKAASILDVPDDIAGLAADLAFGFLASPEEAVAIRVYSMTMLLNLCRREPELCGELRLHLEQLLPSTRKPAFQSRGRMTLEKLDKLEGQKKS